MIKTGIIVIISYSKITLFFVKFLRNNGSNSPAAPPASFSVSYSDRDQYSSDLLTYSLERTLSLPQTTICTWVQTQSQDEVGGKLSECAVC